MEKKPDDETKVVRLFVWGTLRRGECNHRIMESAGGIFRQTAKYTGLPMGEIFDVPKIEIIDKFEKVFGYEREMLNHGEPFPVYYYVREGLDDGILALYLRKEKGMR